MNTVILSEMNAKPVEAMIIMVNILAGLAAVIWINKSEAAGMYRVVRSSTVRVSPKHCARLGVKARPLRASCRKEAPWHGSPKRMLEAGGCGSFMPGAAKATTAMSAEQAPWDTTRRSSAEAWKSIH